MATDLLHFPLPKSATDLFGDPMEDSHPLWLNPSKFSDQEFDLESYISDLRTFVPFDTLRSELRSHLGSLNHDLVELINRDYSDFVSLSTKLVDVDAAVVRMRAPLLEIKENILSFRGSVEGSLMALQSRLKQRARANEAREVLELLLDTFHVVSKQIATTSYLQYCKDVVFSGLRTSFEDLEEEKLLEEFWDLYQNDKNPLQGHVELGTQDDPLHNDKSSGHASQPSTDSH